MFKKAVIDKTSLAAMSITKRIIESAPDEWKSLFDRPHHAVYNNAIVVNSTNGKTIASECITCNAQDKAIVFGDDETNAVILNNAVSEVLTEFQKSSVNKSLCVIVFSNTTVVLGFKKSKSSGMVSATTIAVFTTPRIFAAVDIDNASLLSKTTKIVEQIKKDGFEAVFNPLTVPQISKTTVTERSELFDVN